MLKWFGAGVGCTTAVALGLYTLYIDKDHSSISKVDSFTLPLERDDNARTGDGSRQQVAGLSSGRVLAQGTASGQSENRLGSGWTTAGRNIKAAKPLQQAHADGKPATIGNSWTLRFVSSPKTQPTHRTAAAATPNQQTALTKRIQREMKRAGCSNKIYAHGYWDKTTRAAAVRFVRNNNSAIPTDRPDEALLSLLKNYDGLRCGASQIATSSSNRPLRLKQPPRLVSRTAGSTITTGWVTRIEPDPRRATYQDRRRTAIVSSNAITPSSGRATLQVPRPSRVDAQRRQNYLINGRMALGARSYGRPGERTSTQGTAPLTVRPNGPFGPTDGNQGSNYIAPRYDAERSEALRQELLAAQRRARKAQARKRRTARRRYYRRRSQSNWRARAFRPND